MKMRSLTLFAPITITESEGMNKRVIGIIAMVAWIMLGTLFCIQITVSRKFMLSWEEEIQSTKV